MNEMELTTRIVQTMEQQGFIAKLVRVTGPTSAFVTWQPGTDETAANAALALFDWSEAAHTAWQKQQLADGVEYRKTEIALAMLMRHENNLLRDWVTQLMAAIAGAGSLAALKTAVAALPNMPQRTRMQVVAAYKDKVIEE